MAFPGTRSQRRLNDTAQRIRDELGKGEEVLRHTAAIHIPTTAGAEVRRAIHIPDVDIRVVEAKLIGVGVNFGSEGGSINILAPAGYATAAAAGNRLITAITDALVVPDDTLVRGALTANALRVRAAQPIIGAFITGATGGAGVVVVQLSYILADPFQVTYANY